MVALASGFHTLHRAIEPKDYHADFDAAGAAAMFSEVIGSADCLLAVADPAPGSLAGYVWGQVLDRPWTPFSPALRFLFLQQIFVAPEWRRAKVAAALLEYAAGYGKAQGAAEVFLDTVITNGPALAAFGTRGFRGSGVVMRRGLAESTRA
jgi:GNAT superfamily N-acetyltransferase